MMRIILAALVVCVFGGCGGDVPEKPPVPRRWGITGNSKP